MQSKSGGFLTVRSPGHAVLAIEEVISFTGTKKLDVKKLYDETATLFNQYNLWPVMTITSLGEPQDRLKISGKYLDHLGGFLLADPFNATSTGEVEYTMNVTDIDLHKTDLKELADTWGWKFEDEAV